MAGPSVRKPSPTDLDLLDAIYNRYFDEFAAWSEENRTRRTKIYVPIDIELIARELSVDPDLVFGRLYYHLEHKYGYDDASGSHTPFFEIAIAGDHHCINFPYLASVLASLRDEDRKFRVATTTAVVSPLIAIVSLLLSIFA